MRIILFTNARDEDNILEWTLHHLNFGFDEIYITDHKSIIPIKDTLNKITDKRIKIYREDSEFTTGSYKIRAKGTFITRAINHAVENNFDYMIYLDADEFLILKEYDDVKQFMLKYQDYDQVGLNWLLFGTNLHDTTPTGTILENYTKCDRNLNPHLKSFVKPTEIVNWENTHAYFIKNMDKSISADFNKLNEQKPFFYGQNLSIEKSCGYIAHYMYQCYETYAKRKLNRPRDGTNTFYPPITREVLHTKFNDIENLYPMEKYNENNKRNIENINTN